MNLSRRHILGWGTFVTAGAAFGLAAARTESQRFGPLQSDPKGLLNLPLGFSYRVLAKSGDKMSDGAIRREFPDGMACFAGEDGQLILMSNHECRENGGVSRLLLDAATLNVLFSNDVLTGTQRNCAGGPSPWGWLSCEEYSQGGVWLCPTTAERALVADERRRIRDYGSFQHEAVCIDPERLIAYLTEDDGPSYLYRMVPTDRSQPFFGKLQALCGVGPGIKDTSTMRPGDRFDIKWTQVEPENARASARKKNAALFHRGEGIWFYDEVVYFTATANNQLFKLSPQGDSGTVELVTDDLMSPDNLTVAPHGAVVVAEDQQGRCRLRVVSPNGEVSTFAENALAMGHEFAGVCFAPDGKTLFCNLQKSGHTLAIQGPFQQV